MILAHEIPELSKLYFGESAKLKRHIESVASEILSKDGFEEIVTPIFSYHQHQSVADERELIRINDEKNSHITLRADSTLDVVRLTQKRLGQNTEQKRWFYVQAVYSYPSEEQYQIGAELIDSNDLEAVLALSVAIFKRLELLPLLHISNMKIPHMLVDLFDELSLDDFRHTNIEKFLALKVEWLSKLVYAQSTSQIEDLLSLVPNTLAVELKKLADLQSKIEYKNSVLSPLYYADMLYYDDLYFRFIDANEIFASGGAYTNEGINGVGFAIYTDALIEKMSKGL